MSTSRPLSITLPEDVSRMVRDKVAGGGYSSDSDVVRHGLSVLQARDAAVERWLRDEVLAGCREIADDPSKVIPVQDVLRRIKSRQQLISKE